MFDNPAHHGYVARWPGWPWSSAPEYLAQTDPDEAKRIWRDHPLGDSAFTRSEPAEAGTPNN